MSLLTKLFGGAKPVAKGALEGFRPPVHVVGFTPATFTGKPVSAKKDWQKTELKGFGMLETEAIYVAESSPEKTWKGGKIVPYGSVQIHPAACCLNYGQGAFEGMKARRTDKGRITLFRPDMNAKRMADGARRLVMPPIPEDMFIQACKEVVKANMSCIPDKENGQLYLRPLILGTSPLLGVQPSPICSFMIYTSPVGSYFKGMLKLLVTDGYHRAVPGGLGGVKSITNYASGMLPQVDAKHKGFGEILYLDAVHNRYVEETGASNFFIVKDKTLHTAALTGTILPGVTRDSVLTLARHLGYKINIGPVDIHDAITADEAFASGTGVGVTPVGQITYGGRDYMIGGGKAVGAVTKDISEHLSGIMNESIPDPFGWNYVVA